MKKIFFLCSLFFFPLTAAANFIDVMPQTDYYDSIMGLAVKGVINGYEDGTFLPGKVINRAEFLKISILAKEGSDFPIPENINCFPDVHVADWFAAPVCYAKAQQWINGYQDGSFRPANFISFGEAFTMISNIFQLNTEQFTASDWYYQPQRYFNAYNLIPNIEQSVDFEINRGEMAGLIWNVLQHVSTQKTIINTNTIEHEKMRMAVFEQVNTERVAHEVAPLFYSMQLEEAAQHHAEAMAQNNFFAHTNPATETAVLDRVKYVKYDQRDAGENIAFGQQSAIEVMQSWLNSAPHMKNILDPYYREMGVGIAADTSGDLYWVQVFGLQCEERDKLQGCMKRSEFQERNPGEYHSEFSWY